MSLRQNKQAWSNLRIQFSYQSECHCAKTDVAALHLLHWFSYQSECHCAKTICHDSAHDLCLVTSQNVTAPKQSLSGIAAT